MSNQNGSNTALATTRQQDTAIAAPLQLSTMERVVAVGDLKQLTPQERVQYYLAVCNSCGLNPYTRPFEYIELPDPQNRDATRLTLYARKDATDQLRDLHGVTIVDVQRRLDEDGLYTVEVWVQTPGGRRDVASGVVPMFKEGGEWKTSQNNKKYFVADGTLIPLALTDRANAKMKAETKAKRRATLSICGLGFVDESELDGIKDARRIVVDASTGEIQENVLSRADAFNAIRNRAGEIYGADNTNRTARDEFYAALNGGRDWRELSDDEMRAAAEQASTILTRQQADEFVNAGVLLGGIRRKLREFYAEDQEKWGTLIRAITGGLELDELGAQDLNTLYGKLQPLTKRSQAEDIIAARKIDAPAEFTELTADDEMPF